VEDVARATVFLSQFPFIALQTASQLAIPIFDFVDQSSYTYEELLGYTAGLLKKSHGSRVLPVHLPVSLLRPVAKWQEWLARKFKTRPKLPVDMLDFFMSEMKMNNGPLKNLGFLFSFWDTKKTIENTIDWYLRRGWI